MTSEHTHNRKYQAHSDEQFGKQRNFWWNKDFVSLLVERLDCKEAQSLLDVGCGRCHWSALLIPELPNLLRFAGVDFERKWVESGELSLTEKIGKPLPLSTSFHLADAHKLPFEDSTFDITTCQTVLMHLQNPEQALNEMIRVTKKGGLVLTVEPSNLYSYISFDSISLEQNFCSIVERYRLWFACYQGRKALGLGDHCIGDRLPFLLKSAGLSDVQVVLNDKVRPLVPPYAEDAEVALVENILDWQRNKQVVFNKDEIFRFATAGGLSIEDASKLIEAEESRLSLLVENIQNYRYYSSGGTLNYIAWGRKKI